MAFEKPEIGMDVELGHHLAFAILAAIFGDRSDAVEHQHGWQGQLGIARPEQLAPGTGQQSLKVKIGFPQGLVHDFGSSLKTLVFPCGFPTPKEKDGLPRNTPSCLSSCLEGF